MQTIYVAVRRSLRCEHLAGSLAPVVPAIVSSSLVVELARHEPASLVHDPVASIERTRPTSAGARRSSSGSYVELANPPAGERLDREHDPDYERPRDYSLDHAGELDRPAVLVPVVVHKITPIS